MKKHLVATLLVAVMCLLTLSACSVVAGLENDVNITLNVNGNALDGNYVVNTFNNAIVPVPHPKVMYFWAGRQTRTGKTRTSPTWRCRKTKVLSVTTT